MIIYTYVIIYINREQSCASCSSACNQIVNKPLFMPQTEICRALDREREEFIDNEQVTERVSLV
jgi:hypothetical protein